MIENLDLQYDGFAKEFQEAAEASSDPNRQMMYGLFGSPNLEDARLLDLGCGYGRDLKYFSELGMKVHGVDISPEMIQISKRKVPSAKLDACNFDALPYEDEFFDLVFSRYAIQHTSNTEEVFRETHRVLKPEGGLIFLVVHPLRQYFEKKGTNYWKQENVRSVILNGSLVVHEPSHIFTEYLSPFLLANFYLETFKEREDSEAETLEGSVYPGALIMKYRKKGEK
jgi:ubiquinone/menaquinone biosynthesis C-methylase UbiE